MSVVTGEAEENLKIMGINWHKEATYRKESGRILLEAKINSTL
jgi:hypothetical protein